MTKPTNAPASTTDVGDVVERSKSESDQKKYKLLTLANELQVLLISTKDVPRCADDASHRGDHDDDDDDDDDGSSDDDGDESGEDDDDESMDEGDESYDEEDGDDEHSAPSRRAGACLTVGVGSYAEPTNLPGLAHYLEHMVFMGTSCL